MSQGHIAQCDKEPWLASKPRRMASGDTTTMTRWKGPRQSKPIQISDALATRPTRPEAFSPFTPEFKAAM